jgi:prolyl 4-hydroxylase
MQTVADWLTEQIARGCSAESIVDAMVTAGHNRRAARRQVRREWLASGKLVTGVMADMHEDDDSDDEPEAPSAEALKTLAAQSPNAITTPDREVKVLFALAVPRVVMFGDLLSHDECDALVDASKAKILPSLVVDPHSGEFVPNTGRTSSGTFFLHGENPLVSRIEARVEALLGFEIAQQEPMQILHYMVGAEYLPHYDYFDPAELGSKVPLANGGQRIATLVMYLNDVEAGGSTIFPTMGFEVKPRKGHAVYFESLDASGALDKRTLHGGSPVGEGEKWIATKWIRESKVI